MRQRRKFVALLVLAALTVIDTVIVSLAVAPASVSTHWPGILDYVRIHPWQALAVTTLAGAVISALTLLLARDSPQEVDLGLMADELARAVESNWLYETEKWRVLDPYPLPVGWLPAEPGLLATWADITLTAQGWPAAWRSGADGWISDPSGLAGGADDLADVLRRIPTGRLVVLGDRGAGKTILLARTVLGMLSRRGKGGPVPILLPMASWNPGEQSLLDWMAQWMATTWAPLARPVRRGSQTSVARALLDASLIVPVLDGLDEVTRDLGSLAIDRLNSASGHIRGLIVSCRTAAFAAAVRPAPGLEVPLAGAAGIELSPLANADVANYLQATAGGPAGAARWEPVIIAMSSDPPPPVAQALTTPLMAALARAIYNPPADQALTTGRPDPGELLDQLAFPAKDDIASHLYDRFIPASYLPHPNPAHASRKYRWTGEQAERWLTFLARYLEDPEPDRRTSDFMWWQLGAALPPRRVTLVMCAILGLAAAIDYPFVGFGLGTIAGILTGLAARRWLWQGRDGITRGAAGGILGGLLGALLSAPINGLGPQNTHLTWFISAGFGIGITVGPVGRLRPCIAGGLVATTLTLWFENNAAAQPLRAAIGPGVHLLNGLAIAMTAYLCAEVLGRQAPARGLRWSWLWFACGAATALGFGFIIGFQHGLKAGFTAGSVCMAGAGVMGLVGEPVDTDLDRTADPVAVMRRDRSSFLASWLCLGGLLGIGTGLEWAYGFNRAGQPNSPGEAAVIGITNLLIAGTCFAFIQATWGKYTLAHLLLALSRRLPWRLTAFLQDAATNRGVLRQFGAVYQFRHVELQRQLAGLRPTAPADELILPSSTPSPVAGSRATPVPPGFASGTGSPGQEPGIAEAAGAEAANLGVKPGVLAGHAFISYAREDSRQVDQLQRALEAAGIPVWRDTASLWPGEDWRTEIRRAITSNALVFIACFSRKSLARATSFQNEELTLAIEQLRLRPPDDPWLIPVRLDECQIPDRDIGAGRTLRSIQRAELFGDGADQEAARLVAMVVRILGQSTGAIP